MGGFEKLIDKNSNAYESSFIAHLSSDLAKEEKLFEYTSLYKTPIVRNGKKATVGFCPEIWKEWD